MVYSPYPPASRGESEDTMPSDLFEKARKPAAAIAVEAATRYIGQVPGSLPLADLPPSARPLRAHWRATRGPLRQWERREQRRRPLMPPVHFE